MEDPAISLFLPPRAHLSPHQATSRVLAEGPIPHPLLVTDRDPTQVHLRTHHPGTARVQALTPTKAVPDPAQTPTRAAPDIPQGPLHTAPEKAPVTSLHTRDTD